MHVEIQMKKNYMELRTINDVIGPFIKMIISGLEEIKSPNQ